MLVYLLKLFHGKFLQLHPEPSVWVSDIPAEPYDCQRVLHAQRGHTHHIEGCDSH